MVSSATTAFSATAARQGGYTCRRLVFAYHGIEQTLVGRTRVRGARGLAVPGEKASGWWMQRQGSLEPSWPLAAVTRNFSPRFLQAAPMVGPARGASSCHLFLSFTPPWSVPIAFPNALLSPPFFVISVLLQAARFKPCKDNSIYFQA